MIVNRKIMQDFKISEKDIQFIQKKTREFKGVNVFDKMNKTNKGALVSSPHFYLDEIIEAQKEFINVVRSIAVSRNKEVLKILEKLKKDIGAIENNQVKKLIGVNDGNLHK